MRLIAYKSSKIILYLKKGGARSAQQKIFNKKIDHFKTEIACATQWKTFAVKNRKILSTPAMELELEDTVVGDFFSELLKNLDHPTLEKQAYTAFKKAIETKKNESQDFYDIILMQYNILKIGKCRTRMIFRSF